MVLGGEVYGGEYGEGWGVERPHTIYNGGKPSGGYYRHAVVAQLKATRIGECEGRDAYLKLLIREPRRPGGPLGPWRSWSGPQTICEPYGSYLWK